MRLLTLIGVFLVIIHTSTAQDKTEPESTQADSPIKGKIGLRSFWMSTNYWEDFKNDYALGQSAYLQLRTKEIKGFSLVGKYTVFGRVLSSALLERDPITGNFNRYEVGLFDVRNPSDDLFGKIEELQIRYRSDKFQAVLGKMDINTPFINPQDGRLSPTYVEGLRLQFQPDSKNQFSADIVGRISPRSTSEWFDIGESIGIYPVGQSEFGQPSKYLGNTSSEFFAVLDWKHRFNSGLQLQLNNTYVENISNTVFSQLNKDWELKNNSNKLVTGLQLIIQNGIGEGGNPDPEKRFKNPNDLNYVVGGRIGIKNERSLLYFNYTRMDGRGRFLNPREWGRDPFFTFIPRERNEGYNFVDAFSIYYQRDWKESGLQFYGYAGIHILPDPGSNIEINKYGFPSYAQMNLAGKYTPQNWGKGLDFHLILMSKTNLKSGEMRPQWIYNKVNMIHFNFILNYTIQWK